MIDGHAKRDAVRTKDAARVRIGVDNHIADYAQRLTATRTALVCFIISDRILIHNPTFCASGPRTMKISDCAARGLIRNCSLANARSFASARALYNIARALITSLVWTAMPIGCCRAW